MQGKRESIDSVDGTEIGLLTDGAGPPLLLVHGGMCRLERWAPLWPLLTARYTVTAMDRRGRGSSGDAGSYRLDAEYDDVRAVAEHLRRGAGRPVDVFAHSYGAVCALGAAAQGAPVRRIALYEPPGPQTVPAPWLERLHAFVAAGELGRAVGSFLIEVIGLPREQVLAMRDTPMAYDPLPIMANTMPREAEALSTLDLTALTIAVTQPVLLLLGGTSPAWAPEITRLLHEKLPESTIAVLEGHGHEAVDLAPDLVAGALGEFFADA
ncbi:alpha/beta fold hydrolase [Actinoplanes regularis]|uniref:Pimeloyl-ACP methyl ester carboxylesterase n=1 Tax=Actinoplanes regularis TaxID=52697 RepID=A0A239DS04_9ACTN|nr:alpha/beta hydrolase [Actinoplanes regularis]GIE89026.1 alpha/beta hydrolase [Actinoplanes regularis]SNS35395.1 Pimeloyl-ACP methyl ester carboxylesterase [Actinoplanes regularis]